jgi:hypothetical protein
LLAALGDKVIAPAEAKTKELRQDDRANLTKAPSANTPFAEEIDRA